MNAGMAFGTAAVVTCEVILQENAARFYVFFILFFFFKYLFQSVCPPSSGAHGPIHRICG